MAVKYIKDHKTQETVYPITKSECIIDAHSINNYEIDQLFDGSPEDESSDPGMDYLNYDGLKHYHKKISEEVQTGLDNVQVDLTGYATESWVEEQNYLTEHQDLNGYATEQWVTDKGYLTDVPNYYITETELNAKGYLTEHQDVSGKVDTSRFEEAQLVTSTALNVLQNEVSDKVSLADFEEATQVAAEALNYFNEQLTQKNQEISTLQQQVLELQTQISTLIGHYNELENIIG